MKKFDLRKCWSAFIHWRGWRACVACWSAFIHWRGWGALIRWDGWKRFFILHPAITLLLTVFSAGGLGWIFMNGMEESLPAYILYAFSAYSLIVLICFLARFLEHGNEVLHSNPVTERWLTDQELRFKAKLYRRQFINFGYGIFKIAGGIIYGSAWIGADGIYNLTQAIIQLFQILRRRKALPLQQQWKSYRLCGWLILLMHLTMTGLVFQMLNWGRSAEYPGYMIFATAGFAFYKLISSFIGVAKDRKHKAPIDSAVRLLDLSQAFFSLFSMQVAMFHVFGEGLSYEKLMNTITGYTVCILVIGIGIYMIHRANRTLKYIS